MHCGRRALHRDPAVDAVHSTVCMCGLAVTLVPADASAAKQERLRQAKAEAEKEIAAYKAEREGAYQIKIAEVWPGAGNTRMARSPRFRLSRSLPICGRHSVSLRANSTTCRELGWA